MDLDSWCTTRTAPDAKPNPPVVHTRSEKLGKVWVTPTLKAMLAEMGAPHGIGASGVLALLGEELRAQGQLHQVFKAQRNRRRRRLYHEKYGKRSNEKTMSKTS
jgi:hypothetical protein